MIYQVVKKNGSAFFLMFSNDIIARIWIFTHYMGQIKMIKNVTKNKIL